MQNNQYAGFWKRCAAIIVDTCILIFVLCILQMLDLLLLIYTGHSVRLAIMKFFSQLGLKLAMSGFNIWLTLFLLSILPSCVIWLLYSVPFEFSPLQATPGKLMVGIKVTDLQGNRMSFLRSLGRYFSKIISGLTFGAGFVMAGLSEHKQALHDKFAATLVVVKQEEPPIKIPANLAAFIYFAVVFINMLPFLFAFGVYSYFKKHPEKLLEIFANAISKANPLALSKEGSTGGVHDYNSAGFDFENMDNTDFDEEKFNKSMAELEKMQAELEKSEKALEKTENTLPSESGAGALSHYSNAVKKAKEAKDLLESRQGSDSLVEAVNQEDSRLVDTLLKQGADPNKLLQNADKNNEKQKQSSQANAAPAKTKTQPSYSGVTILPKKKEDYISANQNGMTITTCVKSGKTCCYGAGCKQGQGLKIAAPSKCCD